MQFNVTGLSGNPFLNYVLVSGVEFLAFAASWLAVRSFPRRPSIICFTLLGSLALLLIQITLSLRCEWDHRPPGFTFHCYHHFYHQNSKTQTEATSQIVVNDFGFSRTQLAMDD